MPTCFCSMWLLVTVCPKSLCLTVILILHHAFGVLLSVLWGANMQYLCHITHRLMGRLSGCTAVSSRSCAVMSLHVRLIGTCCCRYVSLHLTQLKVPQRVIHLLTFCMAVSPCYLLNMQYVLLLTALFRPFLNMLLTCRLQWSWFVLLLRVPLRPCLFKPINVIVTLRLQLVRSHGFRPNTFGWLLALHVN